MDLPPELGARRQDIYEKVVGTGRMRRRRRLAAAVVVIAAIVAIPVAALALTGNESHQPRVIASNPSTTVPATDTTESSFVPTTASETTTTASLPTTAPSVAPGTAEPATTTSTAPPCRNSMDPACGPLRYEPPITNEPAAVAVTIAPAHPKVGEKVTFTIHATDPDSWLDAEYLWCNSGGYSFGDHEGIEMGCAVDCIGPGYGPWDAPAPHPSDVTLPLEHTYTKAGAFVATFTVGGGFCDPRPAKATTSIRVDVTAAPANP